MFKNDFQKEALTLTLHMAKEKDRRSL